MIYLGGSVESTLFEGCIKQVYIENDPLHPNLLTDNMYCGQNGITCVGHPLFNACNAKSKPVSPTLVQGIVQDETGFKVDRKPELVTSLKMAPDNLCMVPFLPKHTGLNFTGSESYSKYTRKEFDPTQWRFSLSFRTVHKRGLLFYLANSHQSEHIIVFLVKGKVALRVLLGSQRVRIKTNQRFNDGQWHKTIFERRDNFTQLIVDDIVQPAVEITESSVSFPMRIPVYVGGLHYLPKYQARVVINRRNLIDFTGCIKGVSADRHLLPSEFHFTVSPCFTEHQAGIYFPQTKPGHSNSYIVHQQRYVVGTNIQVAFDFRPRVSDGILFAVDHMDSGDYFNLVLINRQLLLRVRQQGELLEQRFNPSDYNMSLCDGIWHSVAVNKAHHVLMLEVDGIAVTPMSTGTVKKCLTDGPFYIGGKQNYKKVNGLETEEQFVGCMRDIRIDNVLINPEQYRHGDVSLTCPMDP